MRFGDAAPMAVIELVDRNVEEKNQDVPKKSQTEEASNDKSTEGVLTRQPFYSLECEEQF